jgi:hypothetical protein
MIRADFDMIEPAGLLTVPLDRKHKRVLKLYIASGYHPKPRTDAFEEQYRGHPDD